MKQIIPFSKNITFKTKIDSITSISLEHTLKLDNDNLISGTFNISGDYKITDSSKTQEPFSYTIPFDIVLDNSYKIEESTIDIDDFYYEIVDDDVLKINIEVSIEGEECIEKSVEDEILESSINDIEVIDDPKEDVYVFESRDNIRENNKNIIEESDNMIEEINDEKKELEDENKNISNMFDAINNDNNETFTTYNVHIVKESETIDSIIKKYNITKEQFLEYNQEDEIVIGNKLLIPANNE